MGKLYELRLMIEFSGANRSYGYVRYCNVDDAKTAIKKLHNYHIRPGYPLAVTPSVDNRKLCVKTVPPLRPGVSESDTAQEVSKLVEGVADVKFIARRWLQLEFESHRYAALARRMLVPGNQVIFGNVEIKQVDWADPKDEVYQGKEAAGAGDEKIICVRNVGVGVTEETVRHWFNILTEGQVDNVVMSSGSVLITFLSSAAAMTAMEKGNHLDIGGGTRLSLSWWQQQPSGSFSSSARLGAGESSWLASLVTEPPPPPGYGDPLEQMYSGEYLVLSSICRFRLLNTNSLLCCSVCGSGLGAAPVPLLHLGRPPGPGGAPVPGGRAQGVRHLDPRQPKHRPPPRPHQLRPGRPARHRRQQSGKL